jgi:hypothetical protein
MPLGNLCTLADAPAQMADAYLQIGHRPGSWQPVKKQKHSGASPIADYQRRIEIACTTTWQT